MKLVPASEFSVEDWFSAYKVVYNAELAPLMGWDFPALGETPPSFTEFFDDWQSKSKAGNLFAWGVFDADGKFVGYTILHRTPAVPEWELGTAIADASKRRAGIGVRATLHALKYAFEELNAEWVWAISEVKNKEVESILERGGFRRFAHFYLMRHDDFEERWAGRI